MVTDVIHSLGQGTPCRLIIAIRCPKANRLDVCLSWTSAMISTTKIHPGNDSLVTDFCSKTVKRNKKSIIIAASIDKIVSNSPLTLPSGSSMEGLPWLRPLRWIQFPFVEWSLISWGSIASPVPTAGLWVLGCDQRPLRPLRLLRDLWEVRGRYHRGRNALGILWPRCSSACTESSPIHRSCVG